MVIKISVAPADYRLFEVHAQRCRLPLQDYLEEVLSIAACDLRQPAPHYAVTVDDAWGAAASTGCG